MSLVLICLLYCNMQLYSTLDRLILIWSNILGTRVTRAFDLARRKLTIQRKEFEQNSIFPVIQRIDCNASNHENMHNDMTLIRVSFESLYTPVMIFIAVQRITVWIIRIILHTLQCNGYENIGMFPAEEDQ